MDENATASVIVDASFKVHSTLGPGLLESAYQTVLGYELEQRGMTVLRQQYLPLVYGSLRVDDAYRADLIVNDNVIVELKSLEKIAPVHKKQLLTYRRLSGMKLGLLINFGAPLIKEGISRVVNGL